MPWTAPMTAVGNSGAWTAAQWNTHVRDNLLETMPGQATSAPVGWWFAADGANSIKKREIASNRVETAETETNTAYDDMTTVGPAVTVTTGVSAMVFIQAQMESNTADVGSYISYAVSGATTIAASDAWCAKLDGVDANGTHRFGSCNLHTPDSNPLTAGSNTFTMKYKVDSNTSTFDSREIIVLAL